LSKDQRKLFEQLGDTLGKATMPHEGKGIFSRIREELDELKEHL